jgi:hypothetical protein
MNIRGSEQRLLRRVIAAVGAMVLVLGTLGVTLGAGQGG